MATRVINKAFQTATVSCTPTSKTSLVIPYPTGFGLVGTYVLGTFVSLYGRHYQDAARIFAFTVELMDNCIELDFSSADERILNLPIQVILVKY